MSYCSETLKEIFLELPLPAGGMLAVVVGVGAATRCAESKGAAAQCACGSLDDGSTIMSVSKSVWKVNDDCDKGTATSSHSFRDVVLRPVISPTLLCGARARDALQLSMKATCEQRRST
jgi:hypothetical protein